MIHHNHMAYAECEVGEQQGYYSSKEILNRHVSKKSPHLLNLGVPMT